MIATEGSQSRTCRSFTSFVPHVIDANLRPLLQRSEVIAAKFHQYGAVNLICVVDTSALQGIIRIAKHESSCQRRPFFRRSIETRESLLQSIIIDDPERGRLYCFRSSQGR